MKNNCGLIIGKKGVGKTLFCAQFASYLGVRELQWWVERTDGQIEHRRMNFSETKRTLTGIGIGSTQEMQSIYLNIPRGNQVCSLRMTDTTGFCDGVHSDVRVRAVTAQILRSIVDARIVLHVIDVHKLAEVHGPNVHTLHLGRRAATVFSPLDQHLIAYCRTRPAYMILANKIDLPGAKTGLKLLKQALPKERVIPISALTGTGFREVKRHVCRLA